MNPKVCKALAPVTIADDEADGPGTFEVVLSDATMDRDGESIDPDDFEPLPEWLSADMDHEMSCLSTVGSGDVVRDGDRLLCKGTFATTDAGQTLRTLVRDKHIRNVSVAFLRNSTKMASDRGVARKELLNFAFTPVPANTSATVLVSKAHATKEGRRNSSTDQENIQTAHDALVSAGANCDSEADKSLPSGCVLGKSARVAGKVIAGTVEALQQRVVDALDDAYDVGWREDWYFLSLHGVLTADGGGTAYFDAYGDEGLQSYSQTFTDDGRVVTLNDDLTPVDLIEVVLPDYDADEDPNVVTTVVDDDAAVLNSAALAYAALGGTPTS